MATPSDKSDDVNQFLEQIAPGRKAAIEGNRCVPAPIGCGGPATEFNDTLSAKEFTISGLCQKCQDEVFNANDSEG